MLDSVVDYEQDAANGTLAYINHYDDRSLLGERLVDVAQQAAMRARDAPASAHHLMTLAGIAAYYTSAPSATSELALPVTSRIQSRAAAADHADARGHAHLAARQAATCTLPRQAHNARTSL